MPRDYRMQNFSCTPEEKNVLFRRGRGKMGFRSKQRTMEYSEGRGVIAIGT
jgi:hypothetical protein